IGGEWRDAAGGRTLPVEDPATGAVLCEVADATADDAKAALDAAALAQEGWAATPPRARADVLRRAYAEVLDRREELAVLMSPSYGFMAGSAPGRRGLCVGVGLTRPTPGGRSASGSGLMHR
ncbi:MAG TPA: aldehyde dehydrogenase family protein, partial [Acidimicrobiales bacterium]